MNKLFKILLIIFITISTFSVANAITVTSNDSKTNSCPGANVSRTIYLSGDSLSTNIVDYISSTGEKYVGDASSKVGIWTSSSSIASCTGWQRASSLSPGANREVLALLGNCTFNKPTDNSKRTLQFVFNVANYDMFSGNGMNISNFNLRYYFNTTEVRNGVEHNVSYLNTGFGNFDQGLNECLNIELRYCGDGIESTAEGETCDDGNLIDGDGCNSICQDEPVSPIPVCGNNIIEAPETCDDGNLIDGDGCSSTCQLPISPGTCQGGISPIQTAAISAITPNLCSIPIQTVTSFASTVSGNTTSYTWGCNDSTVIHTGGSCLASYTSSVPVLPGTCDAGVTGVQTTAISATTPNLCSNAGELVEGFTSTVSGNTTSYTWGCNDGAALHTGGTCNANYTSGSSTGGVYQCRNIEQTGSNITCTGNSRVDTFKLTCNGTELLEFASNVGNDITSATFSCNDPEAVCHVYDSRVTSVGSYAWRTTSSCDLDDDGSGHGRSNTRCGDGIIQRPNSNSQMEECDFGGGTWPNYCIQSTCRYDESTLPGTGPGNITIPGDGDINFGPGGSVIIGAGMNPFVAYDAGRPYIQNTSDYEMFFDSFCIADVNLGSIDAIDGTSECESLGLMPAHGNKRYFSTYTNFEGKPNTTGNYIDDRLAITVQHNGILYSTAWFANNLDVRVAKSSIATVGGGTSYLASSNNVGNLSDISNNGMLDPLKNKNFVGVGVSSGDISSYSKKIDDTDSINNIGLESTELDSNINNSINATGVNGSIISSDLNDFVNYNGIENVFIIESHDFEINSINSATLALENGARTYIIENGDLIINNDISYSDNIAFVIKGGDIKINESVNSIDGTYITIIKDSVGGKFIGTGGSTTNRLLVNGSLYGNIDDLISNRTYVKQNSFNQLDVGTIVSFGSSLFRKTAPLLSTFIDEYLDSEKIAK